MRRAPGTASIRISCRLPSSSGESKLIPVITSFANFAQLGAGALLVGDDPFLESRRAPIVTLAARHAIPAVYDTRDYTAAGGLMSYGTNRR